MELEAEHQQEDAKHDGIGADPHGEDHSADQWFDYEQDTKPAGDDTAEREPPPAVIVFESERRAEHKPAGHDGPDRYHPDQGNEGDGRPENCDGARGEINDAFNN